MATTPRTRPDREVQYPTSDGKPMAETDVHRDLMATLIQTLEAHFVAEPLVYVSGNLLMSYEEGNKRKHVSPDVFVVRGIAKRPRLYYLTWEEARGPEFVIELTSRSTRSEDVNQKFALYRDLLRVSEYVLFDPLQDYLKPSMQGDRLVEGRYEPIEAVEGRLPSDVLGLHLERAGTQLRLFDPASGLRVPTIAEREVQARAEADSERLRADRAEAGIDKLRRELEALRGRLSGSG